MKTQILIILFTLLTSCNINLNPSQDTKVNLILDTDLGPDYDDVGAMAMMHALADSSYVNILATVASNRNELVVPSIKVLNTYFGRNEIPSGAPMSAQAIDLKSAHYSNWPDSLLHRYAHLRGEETKILDAVHVYREILGKAEDNSITICSIGFLTNLSDLLSSQPDQYSDLSGEMLVLKKVKQLVLMAGEYPKGREYNFYIDIPSSKNVVENWPTEIIFSGFEIGNEILTGLPTSQMNVSNSPVKDVYELCLKGTDLQGRMSWDQTAVLVAVKGYEPYFSVERGRCVFYDDGSNDWAVDGKGKHLRLMKKMDYNELTSVIEEYMKHQPLKR